MADERCADCKFHKKIKFKEYGRRGFEVWHAKCSHPKVKAHVLTSWFACKYFEVI
jgi:hypothetical protein